MKLLNLIKENEEETFEKVLGSAISRFSTDLRNDRVEIATTANDPQAVEKITDTVPELNKIADTINEEVGTALILSLIAAFPKIVEHLASVIKWSNKFFKSTTITTFSDWLMHLGEATHHIYINKIKDVLRYVIPDFKHVDEKIQYELAENVYMAIVATLLVSSGMGAYNAASAGNTTLAGVEGALTAVKNGELKSWLGTQISHIIKGH